MKRRSLFLLATASLLFTLSPIAGKTEEGRLAIRGYDPVAYFTDGKPVPGVSDYEFKWHDARWRFASQAHRDQFSANPDRYAPEYDGYCSMGVGWETPHKDLIDPEAWAIIDGKLYLTHSQDALKKWREHLAENIDRANANWPNVKEQTVVYDGFLEGRKAE
jgi:hypothetical protein